MGTQLAPNVAVVGGGCAGLAAAVALTRAGIKTTLFESSHQLGGRARGIQWQGTTLDNGQHILLGAYSQTLALLQMCGVDISQQILRLPLKLEIPGEFSLKSQTQAPAPLHILIGLLRAKGLTFRERLAAVRLMASLRLKNFHLPADIPLQQLLANQPARLTALLWEPLCLAALNTPLATASAQAFLNVLRDSFAHQKSDSDLLLPRADLSSLIAEPAARLIEAHGGIIKRNTQCDKLINQDNKLIIKFKDGNEEFSHIVVATSPFRVTSLLQECPLLSETVRDCAKLQYEPIYTVYLQYPTEIRLPNAMHGLSGQLGQWVFDRGQLYDQAGLLAVVISAEGEHQQLSQTELANHIHESLQRIFPSLKNIQPIWHKVVAEKRATFACVAGLKRPPQKTQHPHVWLAGDYVSTNNPLQDYPGTIEGAIRSGFKAAENIINSL